MNKIFIKLLFFAGCLPFFTLVFSCNRNSIEDEMKRMENMTVNLNLNNMQCWASDTLVIERPWETKPLKLCVFISEDFCTSCYLKKMFQWEDFIELEKDYNFYIYFIFEPQEGCEENFHKFFYQAELDHPFYLDKKKLFMKENSFIPEQNIFHTFLLDENNHIILIGDILHNEDIEHEFRNIIENAEKESE